LTDEKKTVSPLPPPPLSSEHDPSSHISRQKALKIYYTQIYPYQRRLQYVPFASLLPGQSDTYHLVNDWLDIYAPMIAPNVTLLTLVNHHSVTLKLRLSMFNKSTVYMIGDENPRVHQRYTCVSEAAVREVWLPILSVPASLSQSRRDRAGPFTGMHEKIKQGFNKIIQECPKQVFDIENLLVKNPNNCDHCMACVNVARDVQLDGYISLGTSEAQPLSFVSLAVNNQSEPLIALRQGLISLRLQLQRLAVAAQKLT
jgi:NAD-dependent dihydropyrimidine dehydrogenase PreA subunit